MLIFLKLLAISNMIYSILYLLLINFKKFDSFAFYNKEKSYFKKQSKVSLRNILNKMNFCSKLKHIKDPLKQLRPINFKNKHPSAIFSSNHILTPSTQSNQQQSVTNIDCELGYLQKQQVKPTDLTSSKNQQGFHERSGFGPNLGAFVPSLLNETGVNRKAYIYQKHHNHMQSTPLFHQGNNWIVEIVSMIDCRQTSMLWNRYGNDTFSRWGLKGEMAFTSAEQAVNFCKKNAWEYEVIYSGRRYHQIKSYSENFTFKKEEVSDSEEKDIEFNRI